MALTRYRVPHGAPPQHVHGTPYAPGEHVEADPKTVEAQVNAGLLIADPKPPASKAKPKTEDEAA